MSEDLLTPKIELLQEQIENLERSGHFTESEIDRAVFSLKTELAIYELAASHLKISDSDSHTQILTPTTQK